MEMLTSRAAYELWADSYPPVAHNPLMQAEQAVVMRRLATIRARRALDVGTGSGRYLPLLKAAGVRTIVGADLSPAMLRRNTGRYRICADARHLPLRSKTFDLVNASLMAGDIPDLAPWIAELARVLAPGGHLIYSDFHASWDRRGWQRTFRANDGREWVLPRNAHDLDEHVAALEHAGLEVIVINNVKLPFAARGLRRLLPSRALPVAMVFHARKAAR